jgi:hypothetical protein
MASIMARIPNIIFSFSMAQRYKKKPPAKG